MILRHWCAEPFQFAPMTYLQSVDFKPVGLWFDVDGDWKRWCDEEEFRLSHLVYCYKVTVTNDSGLLHLKQPEELIQFTKQFMEPLYPEQERSIHASCIDWPKVAKYYSGILIAPYQWQCRLSLLWYYGFDCASGCIWDTSIISLSLVE